MVPSFGTLKETRPFREVAVPADDHVRKSVVASSVTVAPVVAVASIWMELSPPVMRVISGAVTVTDSTVIETAGEVVVASKLSVAIAVSE